MRKRTIMLPDFLRGILKSAQYNKATHALEVEVDDTVAYWQNLLFQCNNTGEQSKAYYDEILYFKRNGEHTILVYKHGEMDIPVSLEFILEEINRRWFKQIHEDYVVNVLTVKKATFRSLILMLDGLQYKVPVGPFFRSDCSEFFGISRSPQKS